MSQRRSRYTVAMQDGETKFILAYSADNARAYYESRGHSISKVVKGDIRRNQRNNEIKAQGGYKINRNALNDAVALLGLKRPIEIKHHSRVGKTRGNYRLINGRHVIMLKSYLTPDQASETLWHELTHALQAERCSSTDEWIRFRAQQKNYPYLRRPIEIEAREMSATMADVKLARSFYS